MTADLRFIPHASQRNADVFFVQGFRHRAGDGCFSGSRRADQAKDRAVAFFRQRTYSQIFQDPFFYFRQTVMIRLQDLPRFRKILIVS